jgi:hypothetical protein
MYNSFWRWIDRYFKQGIAMRTWNKTRIIIWSTNCSHNTTAENQVRNRDSCAYVFIKSLEIIKNENFIRHHKLLLKQAHIIVFSIETHPQPS